MPHRAVIRRPQAFSVLRHSWIRALPMRRSHDRVQLRAEPVNSPDSVRPVPDLPKAVIQPVVLLPAPDFLQPQAIWLRSGLWRVPTGHVRVRLFYPIRISEQNSELHRAAIPQPPVCAGLRHSLLQAAPKLHSHDHVLRQSAPVREPQSPAPEQAPLPSTASSIRMLQQALWCSVLACRSLRS